MILNTGSLGVHRFCPQEGHSLVGQTDAKQIIGVLVTVPQAHTVEQNR